MAHIWMKNNNNIRTTPFYIIKNGVVQNGITISQKFFETTTGTQIITSSGYRDFHLRYYVKTNSSIDFGKVSAIGENYQFKLPRNNFTKICLSSNANYPVSSDSGGTNLYVYANANDNGNFIPQYMPTEVGQKSDVKELFLILASLSAGSGVIGEHIANFDYKKKQLFNIVTKMHAYRLNGVSAELIRIYDWNIQNLWLE